MAKHKISVTEECIGCRACVEASDNFFKMDEATNRSKPTKTEVEEGEDLEKAKKGEEVCPVKAIKIE